MKIQKVLMGAVLYVLIMLPGVARAQAFGLDRPSIMAPPVITDVVASNMIAGTANFVVVATIAGQMQRVSKCDRPNQNECMMSDWYLINEPGVSPNPPEIKYAKVYAYVNSQVLSATSVVMTPYPELGENKWKAAVPLAGAVDGDTITYYIVAVDGRGNVASQVSDTGASIQTCPADPTGWNDQYSTPATNNCSFMTSYSKCETNYNGTPISYQASFGINDADNDVCGIPDSGGHQSVVTLPKMDLKGFSVAADSTNLCFRSGLGAAPPDPTDPPPTDGYYIDIVNPDMYDDNPADPWIRNAYELSYIPEVVGYDPSLVRSLWDVNCLTDPNTPNIFDCKLINITGTDPKLKIGYNNGLKFIVKKSGTGDPHAVPYNLIGTTSKTAYVMAVTGEADMSGGGIYWRADRTPAMAFYQKNQQGTVHPPTNPAPPTVPVTNCSVDGTGGAGGVCPKSGSKPEQNVCKITFADSLDAGIVTEYRIYKNTANSFTGAALAATVPKYSTYTWSDTISSDGDKLDGSKYYYFLTSYNADMPDENKRETKGIDAARTNCTVEDWVLPATATITAASTPAGSDSKCKLAFTMPATDPTLVSFYMSRDGSPVNFDTPVAASGATTTYAWTDPTSLQVSHATYTYTVTATDSGGNTATSATASCKMHDLKAPAQIATVAVDNDPGILGILMEWQSSPPAEDVSGYNVYYCPQVNMNACKTFDGQYARLNIGLLTETFVENYTAFTEGDYCFYAEACDRCHSLGTCPENGGSDNCSGFPTGGAGSTMFVKCMTVTLVPEFVKPAFPRNVAVTAPPDGRTCKVTWTKNYVQSDGTAFRNTVNPVPMDLAVYKVMRGPVGGEPPTPTTGTPIGTVPASGTLEFVDSTVEYNICSTPIKTYKYAVYSADISGNYSENGAGGNLAVVSCTPLDCMPPATPTMNVITYGRDICYPSWQPVNENGVNYTLYKCTGDAATCNAANKFTVASNTDTCPRESNGTACSDNEVTMDTTYRYCVTATDDSGNESAKYPPGAQPNCSMCTPSAKPLPITAVTAAATPDNKGVSLYWTNSADDTHQSTAGVNIYRCTANNCSASTRVKSCADLAASSAQVRNISATAPLTIPTGEPAGTWFYGATFQSDCADALTESVIAGAVGAASVTIVEPLPPPCANPAKCIVISSCSDPVAKTGCDGKLNAVNTSGGYPAGGGGFPVAPKAGARVSVLNAAGNEVGSATTDADGNYTIQIDNAGNAVNLSEKFQIVIKITGADKTGVPCNNDLLPPAFVGTDCAIIAKSDFTLTQGAVTTKVTLPKIPEASQGRSEIGNPNCDDTIDGGDFLILRNNYGKDVGPGAGDAKTYADFNGDGTVDGDDFLILRANYGKNLLAAPALVAGLCDH